MRAMTGYLGPVLRLRRESDNVEADAYPDGTASAGVLVGDARQTVAAWSGGGAVRVSRWYNQGGVGATGDLLTSFTVPSGVAWAWTTPITVDNQPTFVNCPTFGPVGNLLFTAGIAGSLVLNGDFTVHYWCKSTVPKSASKTVLWSNQLAHRALHGIGRSAMAVMRFGMHSSFQAYGVPNPGVGMEAWGMVQNQWFHVAVGRASNILKVWFNGAVVYETTNIWFTDAPGRWQPWPR